MCRAGAGHNVGAHQVPCLPPWPRVRVAESVVIWCCLERPHEDGGLEVRARQPGLSSLRMQHVVWAPGVSCPVLPCKMGPTSSLIGATGVIWRLLLVHPNSLTSLMRSPALPPSWRTGEGLPGPGSGALHALPFMPQPDRRLGLVRHLPGVTHVYV